MKISKRKAADLLLQADRVLILAHQSPDGDTLGSSYALLYALRQLGKQARVECSDPIPEKYDYFLRPAQLEELEDPVRTLEFEPEYIVAVDIADEKLFGPKLAKYVGKVDLCIDHHPTNSAYAKYLCLEADAAATAQMMYDILIKMGMKVNELMASCIYTGLSTDTGCFRFSNTQPKTHRLAAKMMECGAPSAKIDRLMFETHSRKRLKLEKLVLDTLNFSPDGRYASVYVTDEMLKAAGSDYNSIEGLENITRSIEGVWVGATLKQKENGFKVSLRTGEEIDASQICAKFGGGGHKRAAGCFLEMPLDEAKEALRKAVQEALFEAGNPVE